MAVCATCGLEIPEGQEVAVVPPRRGLLRRRSAVETLLCPHCADRIDRLLEAETQDPQVALALVSGLVVGLIAALVWFGVALVTDYQLGIISVAVGWLVAQAVMWGAGQKRGGVLPWISLGITALTMVLSEYLIIRRFVVQNLAVEGIGGLPLVLPLAAMGEVIVEGVKAGPLMLLFWAVALWEAYMLVRPRTLERL